LKYQETEDEEITNQDLESKLINAIQQLKPEQQEIIIETEYKNSSFDELSAKWKVPTGTLLSRKSRAINKLKQIIINSEYSKTSPQAVLAGY